MEPSIAQGDWLLVDPTTVRWPRRGSVVAFQEPDSGALSIKRVAGGPGDRVPFREGYLELADDEAWLLADATPDAAMESGFGAPIDSRSYGPVPVAMLVGRVWFRYGPLRRVGRIARRERVDHRVRDAEDPSRLG
jgi:signal peptidase I